MTEIEQVTMSSNEVFIHKIPPLTTSHGHRADSWGIETPLTTCSLKVIQKGDLCFVRLYERGKKTADGHSILFAEAPIRIQGALTVESYAASVIDSSRYFALRIEDAKTRRHALIGIGFRDRQTAFDFKASLQDYERYAKRLQLSKLMEEQKQGVATGDKEENEGEEAESRFKLKEGETISIKLKGGRAQDQSTRRKEKALEADSSLTAATGSFLPPPPPPPARENKQQDALGPCPSQAPQILRPQPKGSEDLGEGGIAEAQKEKDSPAHSADKVEAEEEDWGDFTAA